MIRPICKQDIPQVMDLYNHYVLNSVATFELDPLTESQMLQRVQDIVAHYPFLVYEEKGVVLGYCNIHPFHRFQAYCSTAETSIYLLPVSKGKGVGRALFEALLHEVREQGEWHSLAALITLPNEASIALHEAFGFVKVGHLKEVGTKFERLLDVGYWQLLL